MKHQIAALAACVAKPPVPCAEDVFAYLMDMGTGKSKVILDEFGEGAVNGGPRDLILLAPKGSVRNWYTDKGDATGDWSELRKHLDPDFHERLIDCTWIGSGKTWENKLRLMLAAHRDKSRPRALFMNIEALSMSAGARNLCVEFAEQRGAMVVVDESTTIKGNSNRAEAAIELGRLALSKRILSGLWTPKSPLDLFYQCTFLSERILGFDNFYTFRRRYATLRRQTVYVPGQKNKDGSQKTRKFDVVTGYQNLEDLQEKVGRYSYRVLKKDCLDLQPKTYMMRDVELTKEQKKMLTEIKHFGHAAIGDTGKFVTVDMVIKRIIREIQITCGYVMDDEERVLHEVPENKTAALMEVLEDHVGKAIIWCPWRAPLSKIVRVASEKYGPESVAQFHGGNVRTRHEEERRFLNDPKCLYMFATQGAGMRGNTWVNADLTVYYANNFDLEMRDQSEDRNHRVGQKNRVTYIDLVTQGTHELKMIQALRKKIDLATLINNEGYREWLV
jgi:hypothetical protein